MSNDQKKDQPKINPQADAANPDFQAVPVPDVEFVVPFLSVAESADVQANPELLGMYMAHVRTMIDAKTWEAIQNGATASRIRLFVDFE